MPQERRVSPAVIIIPAGLALGGLAAAALYTLAQGAPPSELIGDLNDDGVVDWADYDILIKYILGYPISEISPLSEEEFLYRADVNGDGEINVGDLTALAKIMPVANLYGVVTDADTGKPIADVLVTLDDIQTFTDAQGNYALTDLEPGEYRLEFSKAGYQTLVY